MSAPRFQRNAKAFKRGTLAPWPDDQPRPAEVAGRVRYVPSGEHKRHASPTGQWAYGTRSDKAKCDPYPEPAWPVILGTLQDAIRAGIADRDFRGGYPSRTWAYVNGKLHEARLTNQDDGSYHAFPLDYVEQHPEDPDGLLAGSPRVAIALA